MTYQLLEDGVPIKTFEQGPIMVPIEFYSEARAEREAKRRLLSWMDDEEEREKGLQRLVLYPAPVYEIVESRYEVIRTIKLEDVQ